MNQKTKEKRKKQEDVQKFNRRKKALAVSEKMCADVEDIMLVVSNTVILIITITTNQ